MSQYAVLVAEKGSNETTAYGPYRTLARAQEIRDAFRDPASGDYYPSGEYAVDAVVLRATTFRGVTS